MSAAAAAAASSPSSVQNRRFNLTKERWAASLGRKLHADCRKPSADSAVGTERVGGPFAFGLDEIPALVAIILPVVNGHLAQQPGYVIVPAESSWREVVGFVHKLVAIKKRAERSLWRPHFLDLHQELLKHLLQHLSRGRLVADQIGRSCLRIARVVHGEGSRGGMI